MSADKATDDFIRAARRLGYQARTGRRSHVKLYSPDGRLVTVLPSSKQKEGKHVRALTGQLRRGGWDDLAALLR